MKTNTAAVDFYSEKGSQVYEDALNKGFVYGEITTEFLRPIRLTGSERLLLDVGCGTGFVFDVLKPEILKHHVRSVGVDPAEGMLDIARPKFAGLSEISFEKGSFEKLPFADGSADRMTSTLALHWVDDLEIAVRELARVLSPKGRLDLLMIAADDGAKFKSGIFNAQKKHLTFAQAMRAAAHVKRVHPPVLEAIFRRCFPNRDVEVLNPRRVVYGSFDEHMKWWKARSQSIIHEVKDKAAFMKDLQAELEKLADAQGIPFDSSCLTVKVS